MSCLSKLPDFIAALAAIFFFEAEAILLAVNQASLGNRD